MAQFNVNDFCASPSLDQLKTQNIKKDDWKAIARHFEVPITSQMTKEILKNVVIEYLVGNNILEQEAIEELTPMSASRITKAPISPIEYDRSIDSQLEMEKLKLEYQFKMQEMQLQERQAERELNAQKEREEREFQLQMQRSQREDKELEIRGLTAQNESKFRQEEIDLKKKLSAFNPATAAPLVPTFDESDVDGSFKAFESVARRNEWPDDQWVSLLIPKLVGKAYRVYNSLDQANYEDIKRSILDAYSITPDGYRQQFRKYLKPDFHTYVEFASEKLRQLKKWLDTTNTRAPM
ncbi:hypothetical protein ECANGB1_1400 [Enterospora canceri]|uniref:Uncharacterized protein n=1 Tax=Enterospora canceri TaxID=1081671 RepID=A0A1Y1S532_9MICR|nr:hypothetical protein ECANGB1_1400 [Enterospora canceri]